MSAKLYLFNLCAIPTLLLFAECKKNETEPMEQTVLNSDETNGIAYLALGDSYTKAECEQSAQSYPAQLAVKLNASDLPVKNQKIIAQTGWRTDNLRNAVENAKLENKYDLVSLLIGVNNQYQGRSVDQYRKEFRSLLETSVTLARGRKDKVFVVSIPDYGVTPFGSANEAYISQQIDLFNAVNKEVTDSMGIAYIDITPISRKAKQDTTLTCHDNLHPSGKMYGEWVDLMFPIVKSIVQKP